MGQEQMTNLQQRKEGEEEWDQEQEDAISLCDLSTDHYSDDYDNGGNLDQFDRDSEDDNFEFSFNNPSIITNQNDAGLINSDDDSINAINFCGKIIGYNNGSGNDNNARNYKQQGEAVNTTRVENQTLRLKKSASSESQSQSQPQLATGSNRYRSGSKSNSSRYKPMVLIGLVKIRTEMDLSDIKKRQSKMRNPTTTSPMPPGTAGGDNGSTAGGGGSERRRNSNRWGLVRSLTCGARFGNAFARTAFSCFTFSDFRVAN
ncbi:hypothetical protein KPL71_011525 [Citrus sinensis]|uniref:Uncharacterized protein n=2 Tax=Citrus sinensis TaxID=2711 RepID=A0ACB8L4J1_CITSI|nr:hypothetical protein KPL71_011525 [Citrus sinensis]